jgi:hypothetical protein
VYTDTVEVCTPADADVVRDQHGVDGHLNAQLPNASLTIVVTMQHMA